MTAETLSVVQLFRVFPTENACYAWLEKVRWQNQPTCPNCGGIENMSRPASKPHHYWHKDCRKQFTVTTKTCMHATKRPLQDWIYTIYSVLTARKGISAMQLSKELGVQYRTAWHMLNRIREACVRGDFTLNIVVDEVDETYIGDKEASKHESKKLHAGRSAVGKETVTHKSEYIRDEAHIHSIESIWVALKRAVHGTWHHVSPRDSGRYVNKAMFRLNEGNCRIDTIDRMSKFVRDVGEKRLAIYRSDRGQRIVWQND